MITVLEYNDLRNKPRVITFRDGDRYAFDENDKLIILKRKGRLLKKVSDYPHYREACGLFEEVK